MTGLPNNMDPQIEYRFKIIEKDIEVLQLKQKDLEEYTKQTTALGYKMKSLEDKLDEVCEKLEKVAESSAANGKGFMNIIAELLKLLGVAFLILASLYGVKLALPTIKGETTTYGHISNYSIATVYHPQNDSSLLHGGGWKEDNSNSS